MIQAFHKYKPASLGALALLVYADGKDRVTQEYMADMLYACAYRRGVQPPRLRDLLNAKPRKAMTREKGNAFVDKLLRVFKKGGKQ